MDFIGRQITVPEGTVMARKLTNNPLVEAAARSPNCWLGCGMAMGGNRQIIIGLAPEYSSFNMIIKKVLIQVAPGKQIIFLIQHLV